jgi:hypothetical protein
MERLLHNYLGCRVTAQNREGVFEGKLVGIKVDGSALKIVLAQAKTFSTIDNVSWFSVYDGHKLVFTAQPIQEGKQ